MRLSLPSLPSLALLALLAALGACSASSDASTPDDSMPDQNPETVASAPAGESTPTEAGFYALQTNSLEGEAFDLGQLKGRVSLVVNVASRCGYTRQYAGLQSLHAELQDSGFQVLGFPSNDFGGQEPGSAAEIREFCTSNYSVEFPMFEKVATKGADQSPVYAKLAEMADGATPNWNFCKYLVGKDGQVIGFWKSSTAPDSAELRAAIRKALDA